MPKRSAVLSTMVLSPLAALYGAGVGLRNKLFDFGMLPRQRFDVPIIVVGNIAVGGTGKTPHVEYIIKAMSKRHRIGVLSRGYKRQTKGFVLADSDSTPQSIGDEPYQIYRKFGDRVDVAVCEDRRKGIELLTELKPDINLLVLDDAFQHRYVEPTVAVVLTEFSKPVFSDRLLPLGSLRESRKALNRADVVVVTKCPDEVKPLDIRRFVMNLNLYPYQKLFFSRIRYDRPLPVFPESASDAYLNLDTLTDRDTLLAIAGIANPVQFVRYLKKFRAKVVARRYPDHHDFDIDDLRTIYRRFNEIKGERKYIITTEKDAMRLMGNDKLPKILKANMYYLPMHVQFMEYHDSNFTETIEKLLIEARKT